MPRDYRFGTFIRWRTSKKGKVKGTQRPTGALVGMGGKIVGILFNKGKPQVYTREYTKTGIFEKFYPAKWK